jgi:hypothetical protein
MAENPFAYQKEGKEGLPDFGLSIGPHMGRVFFFRIIFVTWCQKTFLKIGSFKKV